MLNGAEYTIQVWIRVRCAALLAGYGGTEDMLDAMAAPGMAYSTLRRMGKGLEVRVPFDLLARAVADHCAERGALVPASWVLHGFEGPPAIRMDPKQLDQLAIQIADRLRRED